MEMGGCSFVHSYTNVTEDFYTMVNLASTKILIHTISQTLIDCLMQINAFLPNVLNIHGMQVENHIQLKRNTKLVMNSVKQEKCVTF